MIDNTNEPKPIPGHPAERARDQAVARSTTQGLDHTAAMRRHARPAVNGAGAFSWARRIDGLALFTFACGVNFLFGYGQQRALGLLMIVAFLLANLGRLDRALRSLRPVPPEILLLTACVLWAGITGPMVAVDLGMFWVGFRVSLQVVVMVWATYAISTVSRSANAVFLGLVAGALVQIVLVLSDAADLRAFMSVGDRTLGSMRNPNSLGFLMVWCVVCALVFWQGSRRGRMVRKALTLAVVPPAVFVLLASGSRKSALAMGLVLFGWATFGRGTTMNVGRVVGSVIVGGVVVIGFVTILPELAERTPVGRRFQQFADSGGGDIGQAIVRERRYDMYVAGLRIAVDHPIAGVGLNNFGKYFYSGQYSHSDFIEPLATTGLVGFVLYQSFYFLLISRILRLLRVVRDRKDRYRLRVYLMGIMAIMVIGLGAPHYTSSPVFLLLTAFSVSTWTLQRRLMQKVTFDSQWARAARTRAVPPCQIAGRQASPRRFI